MSNTTLVVMAAGLGSRYGGLKQIAPVDNARHILIDFSIYDAVRAGFDKLVCIVKPELEQEFHEAIGRRIAPFIDLHYAFQRPDALPKGYSVPEGRTKPWGTAHAVLCAKDQIHTPFAVINADDFYGRTAFESIHTFLSEPHAANEHAMVGYRVENTLTEHGSVARGVCETDADGYLVGVTERTHIEPREGGAAFTEDGEHFTFVPAGAIVSMNLWGFQPSILDEIENRFPAYLDANLPVNPFKCEYFLPLIPNALIQEGKGSVKVLGTHEKWYGVTYKEDMPKVQAAIAQMKRQGVYPDELWRK
ncbi:MAG: nucleotidyltransferase [Clostridiales bacterium]|nr:nucleotidyltransferase [Clostridiales bacterium]MDO4350051.1 sugar phosphate nucleotidyltransferase [Eubacteriales bacterium]MDY4009204.1 sugar phosphate nucleotidyltransferase [Candidatus Limiplasma sp.]